MQQPHIFRTEVLNKKNAGIFVMLAFSYAFFLLIPFLILLFAQIDGTLGSDETGSTNKFELNTLHFTEAGYRVLIRLSIFSSVVAFGAIGAAISVISRAHSDHPEGSAISVVELLSIQTIGAVFALILSLMFMGEMIAGSLFPHWEPFYRIIYSPAAFAKLLVWSFLAGFSERLVPRILLNLSRHADVETTIINKPDQNLEEK